MIAARLVHRYNLAQALDTFRLASYHISRNGTTGRDHSFRFTDIQGSALDTAQADALEQQGRMLGPQALAELA